MLTQLVPYVGLAAFTLVVPITLAILGVLFFVTLSYLEVIQLYTKAGGSYVVARDNFGPKVAQVAAVALLIDYTVTVAVQTSAGTAALTSAVPGLLVAWTRCRSPSRVVLLLLVREPAGPSRGRKVLRLPHLLLRSAVMGLGHRRRLRASAVLGDIHPLHPSSQCTTRYSGPWHIGHPNGANGWLMGASA